MYFKKNKCAMSDISRLILEFKWTNGSILLRRKQLKNYKKTEKLRQAQC